MPNVSPPSSSLLSDNDSDISEISSYEAAVIQWRKENRQLLASLGLLPVYIVSYVAKMLYVYMVLQEPTIPKPKQQAFNKDSLNVSEFVHGKHRPCV